MKKYKLLALFILLLPIKGFAQIHKVPGLSQNTNFYISQTSSKLTFIASIDGLNIFDGIQNKVYRSSTHNMYGNNIQSQFYEDSIGHIWFCTYEALHEYMPEVDNFNYYFASDSIGSIKSGYRIVNLKSNNLIFQAGQGLYNFNIGTKKQTRKFSFNFHDVFRYEYYKDGDKDIIAGLSQDRIRFVVLDKFANILSSYEFKISASSIFITKSGLWIGEIDGQLSFFNFLNKTIESSFNISSKILSSIRMLRSNLLVITSPDQITEFDIEHKTVKKQYNIREPGSEEILKNVNHYSISNDSTLWLASDGGGTYFYNLKKNKFIHGSKFIDNSYPSITGIHSFENDQTLILTTRLNGLIKINRAGEIQSHIKTVNNISNFTCLTSCKIDSSNLLLFIYGDLYKYNIENDSIIKLIYTGKLKPNNLYSLQKNKTRYFCSDYSENILELMLDGNNFEFVRRKDIFWNEKIVTKIKTFDNAQYFVSLDDEFISILDYDLTKNKFSEKGRISLKGGVLAVNKTLPDSSVLITNVNGLFKLNLNDLSHIQVFGLNNELAQTIYSLYTDDTNTLWLATNRGVFSVNLDSFSIHQFNKSDGIQSMEFNSNASRKLDDGTLLFGGINGINIFNPKDVNLVGTRSPVIITEYKINDTITSSYGVANFVDEMQMPYDENTISFTFHAIDYSDPLVTRVKYKLKGVDKNYIQSDHAEGFARYANLKPGKYQLSIYGSNGDQVWNKEDRKVNFEILAPFWMTWWFRTLSALLIAGVLFLSIRLYYNQRLRRQDFLLKEQNLIIEKQEALQNERTRIAGEMHDDLGGGLTTIKFLSLKIIKNIKEESTKKSLQKIVNHSHDLIANMSEIIWAMNAGFDTLDNLIAYTRRYAKEFLVEHEINLKFEVEGQSEGIRFSGEKRRNIFLVIKEALHNTIKHANGSIFEIKYLIGGSLKIELTDNGKGLSQQNEVRGNGLKNMKSRISKMGGTIEIENGRSGLNINIEIPLKD